LEGAVDLIVRTASLPGVEIAHGLSYLEPREFRPIANNEFPTNPLITFERHVDIFKMRNPIRSFHEKSVAIPYRAAVIKIEFKDSKMNQAGE
jgi:hypothetical protein